jgi:hypothetical protein
MWEEMLFAEELASLDIRIKAIADAANELHD